MHYNSLGPRVASYRLRKLDQYWTLSFAEVPALQLHQHKKQYSELFDRAGYSVLLFVDNPASCNITFVCVRPALQALVIWSTDSLIILAFAKSRFCIISSYILLVTWRSLLILTHQLARSFSFRT